MNGPNKLTVNPGDVLQIMANQKARAAASSSSGAGNSTARGSGGSGATASGSGGLKPQFKVNEKVLCYEPDIKKAQVLYDSKVLEVVRKQDPSTGGVHYEYKIHFQGWKCTWDRYVREDNVLKTSNENRELQKQLRERVDEDKAMQKKKKSKKITIKEKIQAVQAAAAVVPFNAKPKLEAATKTSKGINKGNKIQRKKEKKIYDYPKVVGSHEAALYPHSEHLIITGDLKRILEYDRNKIRTNKWLVKLPCQITVIDLLEEYLYHTGRLELRSYIQKVQTLSLSARNTGGSKTTKHRTATTQAKPTRPNQDIVKIVNAELIKTMKRITFSKRVVEDVRNMFDFLLPQVLLYNNELDQYNEFRNGDFSPQKQQQQPRKPKKEQPQQKKMPVLLPKPVVVEKPKPVEDDSDDLIIQNVIKKNMPPPAVPPLKRRTRSAGNNYDHLASMSPLDLEATNTKKGMGRKSTSALPSTSSSLLSSQSSTTYTSNKTNIMSAAELDPTMPLEMMPLSEIKIEPLEDDVAVESIVPAADEPPTKRRKIASGGSSSSSASEAINNNVNLPGCSYSSAPPLLIKESLITRPPPKKENSQSPQPLAPQLSSGDNITEWPAALFYGSDKFGCELEEKCEFAWACQHLNKFMDELDRYELVPQSEVSGQGPSASACYGMHHLLRLFVRMPGVLSATTIPRSKMKGIVAEMNSILKYFITIRGIVTKEDWHLNPGIILYAEDYINEKNCHLFAKGTPPSRKLLKKSKQKSRNSKGKRDKKSKSKKPSCLVTDPKKSKKKKGKRTKDKKKLKKVKRGRKKKSKASRRLSLSPIKTIKKAGQKSSSSPIRVAVQLQVNISSGVSSKRNSRRLSGKIDSSMSGGGSHHGAIAMGVRKSLTQEELSRETLVAANITAVATTSRSSTTVKAKARTSSPKSNSPSNNAKKNNSSSSSNIEIKSKTSYSLRHHSRPSYK